MIHEHVHESEQDRQFLEQFQNLTLNELAHIDHLRLAWLYLNRYAVNDAANLLCKHLKAYAESKGAFDKFHYTITDALVRIMAKRTANRQPIAWQTFLTVNEDVANDWQTVLQQHYSKQLLKRVEARKLILKPDRLPL